jgi:hypothetical protein
LEEKNILSMLLRSIVVTDNAPYHTVLENKPPTISSRESDIIMWLQNNKSAVDPELTKNELLQTMRFYKLQLTMFKEMTWKNLSEIKHEAWIKLVILCKKLNNTGAGMR